MNPALPRLGYGVVLVAAPRQALRRAGATSEGDFPEHVLVFARVLGARHVLQALLEATTWPRWRRLGAATDLLHAASEVAIAAADPRWRRPALMDGGVAAALALPGLFTKSSD